jgi:hypothetical protein
MRRWLAGLAVVGLTTPLSVLGTAPAAHAQDVGYVRLAHLSPDTPEVDVYLSSQSSGFKEQIFRGVGYGIMSKYLALPVGGYVVAMRPSGAAASTPPVLTTQVSVTSGGAFTVAGVGHYAELGSRYSRTISPCLPRTRPRCASCRPRCRRRFWGCRSPMGRASPRTSPSPPRPTTNWLIRAAGG